MTGFSIKDICPELDISQCTEYFSSPESGSSITSPTNYSVKTCSDTPKISNRRPNISYSAMIMEAINSSVEKKLTLSEIYEYIKENWPYYAKCPHTRWQNSVRHTLSTKEYFVKCKRGLMTGTKGCFWFISPKYSTNLKNGKVMKNHRNWLENYKTSSTLFNNETSVSEYCKYYLEHLI